MVMFNLIFSLIAFGLCLFGLSWLMYNDAVIRKWWGMGVGLLLIIGMAIAAVVAAGMLAGVW